MPKKRPAASVFGQRPPFPHSFAFYGVRERENEGRREGVLLTEISSTSAAAKKERLVLRLLRSFPHTDRRPNGRKVLSVMPLFSPAA